MEVNNVNPQKVRMTVTSDKIKININRDKVLPAYMHYLCEYWGVDCTDRTIEFKDCTCKLVKTKGGYEWAE